MIPPGNRTKVLGGLSEPKEHALGHSRFQLFTRLARWNRKEEALMLFGGGRWPLPPRRRMVGRYFSDSVSSVWYYLSNQVWPWLGSPYGGFFSTGCSNCELVFLILLGSTRVCVAYTQTYIPLLFLLRCLFPSILPDIPSQQNWLQ